MAGVITSVPVDDVTESSLSQRPIPYWGSRFLEHKEPTRMHPDHLKHTRLETMRTLEIMNETGRPQTMLLITCQVQEIV